MNAYQKANKLVREMSDMHLLSVWNAICNGGLGDAEVVNDIPADDWVELVCGEISIVRGLTWRYNA